MISPARALVALAALTVPGMGACTDRDLAPPVDEDDGADQDDPDPDAPCDVDHLGEAGECEDGTAYCVRDADTGKYAWGVCVVQPECEPGDADDCGACVLDEDGVPVWEGGCVATTPLVLSFDGAAIAYSTSDRFFDLGPVCAATDWPTAATPWLALDRDRSGTIDGGHELFGSATRLRAGGTAVHGFQALAELDGDGDGRITAADPGFAGLVVWADGDDDRRSTGFELQPVASLGLVAIELEFMSDRRCDARANCEVERAGFVWRDAIGQERGGEVVDVHLGCR